MGLPTNRQLTLIQGGNDTPAPPKKRTLTVLLDEDIEYPDMYLSVYVSGPELDAQGFPEMFARARCYKARSPDEADLVVFTGGTDVDPVLYGAKPHSSTCASPARDKEDIELYSKCYKEGIPMLGICRGAQFLWVMNGGKLYQDVASHYGDHPIYDVVAKKALKSVSSVHHQMCMPETCPGAEILAEAYKSEKKWVDPDTVESGRNRDIEAYFIRETCCLGIQGHPEYRGYAEFTAWSLNLIKQYIWEDPDIKLKGSVIRVLPDILKQRPAFLQVSAKQEMN